MLPVTVRVTDEEFHQLVGTNLQAFAARLRAETMAHDLKARIALVASDLRHWIAAGEVADPTGASRIANAFDHLAGEFEAEVRQNDAARWFGGDVEDIGIHRECDITEYEFEAWHAPADQIPGKGKEGR